MAETETVANPEGNGTSSQIAGALVSASAIDAGAQGKAESPIAVKPLAPIIVKKITEEIHGGGHGGAWKIALADMMTAMMAFFLLMWLLGATNADQRKGVADYFKPIALTTSVLSVNQASGSVGVMGGESIIDETALRHAAAQTGLMQILTPRDATGNKDTGGRVRGGNQRRGERSHGLARAAGECSAAGYAHKRRLRGHPRRVVCFDDDLIQCIRDCGHTVSPNPET